MRKKIIVLLIILFFLGTLIVLIPPADFYKELTKGNLPLWQIISLVALGSIIAGVIGLLKVKYPEEYKEANRISYTPYTKYGWCALIFFVSFFICFFLYAIFFS